MTRAEASSHTLVTTALGAATILATVSTQAIRGADAATADAPTTELLTGVVGDRCPNCQSPMAADQRYCLNCGERRGRARVSPDTYAREIVTTTSTAAPPVLPPRSRLSSGTTLVAGVATLLLAMGVGVLIGVNSNNSSGRAPAPQVVTINGGGVSANTASTPTSTPTASSAKAGKPVKPAVVHVTAKTAKAATAAAGKVLGNTKNLSNNVNQSVGGSCTGGAGCQGGKFTGNFFPGG